MTALNASLALRLPCAVFALMLFWSAAMQVNDPDPEAWIAIYVLLGLVSALALADRQVRVVTVLALAASLFWSVSLMPSVVALFTGHPAGDLLSGMSPDRPYVEEARESLGLLIGALACAHVLWLGWRSRRPGGRRRA